MAPGMMDPRFNRKRLPKRPPAPVVEEPEAAMPPAPEPVVETPAADAADVPWGKPTRKKKQPEDGGDAE